MSQQANQTLRELVRDKQIYIVYDKINSQYLQDYKDKLWSDIEHFYHVTFIYATERKKQKMFRGKLIFQGKNEIYQLVYDDYSLLTNIIFVAAIIQQLNQRDKCTQETESTFRKTIKEETKYRVLIDEKSNQFFRDYVIDRTKGNTIHCENPAEQCIKDIFDFYEIQLGKETGEVISDMLEVAINTEFHIVYH